MFVLSPILVAAAAKCQQDPDYPPCKDFLAGPPEWVQWLGGGVSATVIIATIVIFFWDRRKKG